GQWLVAARRRSRLRIGPPSPVGHLGGSSGTDRRTLSSTGTNVRWAHIRAASTSRQVIRSAALEASKNLNIRTWQQPELRRVSTKTTADGELQIGDGTVSGSAPI